LQRTATHRNTPQHSATHGNTLQHFATHCNTGEVTARQLARSVQEGLASTEDSDSFEAVQRRLLSRVQEQMKSAASQGLDAATQSGVLRVVAVFCVKQYWNYPSAQ